MGHTCLPKLHRQSEMCVNFLADSRCSINVENLFSGSGYLVFNKMFCQDCHDTLLLPTNLNILLQKCQRSPAGAVSCRPRDCPGRSGAPAWSAGTPRRRWLSPQKLLTNACHCYRTQRSYIFPQFYYVHFLHINISETGMWLTICQEYPFEQS